MRVRLNSGVRSIFILAQLGDSEELDKVLLVNHILKYLLLGVVRIK